jgi:hypothetical protein
LHNNKNSTVIGIHPETVDSQLSKSYLSKKCATTKTIFSSLFDQKIMKVLEKIKLNTAENV